MCLSRASLPFWGRGIWLFIRPIYGECFTIDWSIRPIGSPSVNAWKKKKKKKCSPALSPNTEGREWWTVHFQFTPPLTHLLLSSWGSSVAQDTYTQQPKTGDVQPSFNRACPRNTRVISFSRSMPRSILPNLKKKRKYFPAHPSAKSVALYARLSCGRCLLKEKKKIAAFGIRSNTRMPRSTFSNKIYFQCRMNGALWVSFFKKRGGAWRWRYAGALLWETLPYSWTLWFISFRWIIRLQESFFFAFRDTFPLGVPTQLTSFTAPLRHWQRWVHLTPPFSLFFSFLFFSFFFFCIDSEWLPFLFLHLSDSR